jgi:hypothetical protein
MAGMVGVPGVGLPSAPMREQRVMPDLIAEMQLRNGLRTGGRNSITTASGILLSGHVAPAIALMPQLDRGAGDPAEPCGFGLIAAGGKTPHLVGVLHLGRHGTLAVFHDAPPINAQGHDIIVKEQSMERSRWEWERPYGKCCPERAPSCPLCWPEVEDSFIERIGIPGEAVRRGVRARGWSLQPRADIDHGAAGMLGDIERSRPRHVWRRHAGPAD